MVTQFEVVPACRDHYNHDIEFYLQVARERVEEWSWNDDKHGYCHERSVLAGLVNEVERLRETQLPVEPVKPLFKFKFLRRTGWTTRGPNPNADRTQVVVIATTEDEARDKVIAASRKLEHGWAYFLLLLDVKEVKP